MTEVEALELVESKRDKLEIDSEMEQDSAVKAIVEYKKKPSSPGKTEDRIAWVVTYTSAMGYVQVHVDDKSGKILAVQRSA